MQILNASVIGSFSAAALLAGCAGSPPVVPPYTPEALRPPANQVLALEALATGVQIYECAGDRDQPARFEWVFKAPAAPCSSGNAQRVARVPYKAVYYFYVARP